ncbi:MAG: sulfotransferase, partial [Betaproteobacteria bacterium]
QHSRRPNRNPPAADPMRYDVQYGSPVSHRYRGTYLFVVSHMRSFSSLLCHILGTHPEISGYGETHRSYLGRTDLNRLARTVREQTGEASLGRFLVDKVLHNHVEFAPTMLARPDVRVVFLLRHAEDTLASILNMAHALGHVGPYADLAQVTDYYVNRLKQMENQSAQVTGNAYYIDSERLVDETDAVLDGLSRWLALGTGLTPEYRTFPLTGVPGHGDPSPHIRAGRVVKSPAERHRDYKAVAIPEEALRRAEAAYTACREALSALR